MMQKVYDGLPSEFVALVRQLENDRNLKRHCSYDSTVALAKLSLLADVVEEAIKKVN